MARLQGRAVDRRAPSTAVGLRPRGARVPHRVAVLAPGKAPTRVQPDDRLPRAGRGYEVFAPHLPAQLPQSRQGVRRPDAAPAVSSRVDALTAQGAGPRVPG